MSRQIAVRLGHVGGGDNAGYGVPLVPDEDEVVLGQGGQDVDQVMVVADVPRVHDGLREVGVGVGVPGTSYRFPRDGSRQAVRTG